LRSGRATLAHGPFDVGAERVIVHLTSRWRSVASGPWPDVDAAAVISRSGRSRRTCADAARASATRGSLPVETHRAVRPQLAQGAQVDARSGGRQEARCPPSPVQVQEDFGRAAPGRDGACPRAGSLRTRSGTAWPSPKGASASAASVAVLKDMLRAPRRSCCTAGASGGSPGLLPRQRAARCSAQAPSLATWLAPRTGAYWRITHPPCWREDGPARLPAPARPPQLVSSLELRVPRCRCVQGRQPRSGRRRARAAVGAAEADVGARALPSVGTPLSRP